MSQRKSERLINLLIALLSTRRYLTKHELRQLIEDYRGTSQQAFERMFERDKEELRALGIGIETGSDDPFSEEEDGYRVHRSDFELPPLSFTSAELAALGLAAQVWQDSVAADHTARALEALRAAGAEPDAAMIPVVRPQVSGEADFDTVYGALVQRRELVFGYGDHQRRLQPWKLIQRRGRWYVFGFDLDRQAERFFKLSRFTSPAQHIGKPGAYDVPDDLDERAARLEPGLHATAIVAVREETARWRAAEPVDHEAPPGYRAYRVHAASSDQLVDDVVEASPDVVLLSPGELRSRVVQRLQRSLR